MNDADRVTVHPGRNPGRRKLLLWLELVLCCAVFSAVVVSVDRARQRHEAAARRLDRDRRDVTSLVWSSLTADRRLTPALTGGREPEVVAGHGRATVIRVPVAGYDGWAVKGMLRDDRLVTFQVIPPPHTPYPGPSPAWRQLDKLRRGLLVVAAGAWLVAAAALPFAGPWRREVAQVCLAAVLVAATAWAVDPVRTWARADLLTPWPIAIAAAAVLSGLALLLPVPPRDAARGRSCPACGYDLTGNVSGVCPECGAMTPRMRAERWRGQAERIEAVEVEPVPDDGAEEDADRLAGDTSAALASPYSRPADALA